MLRYIRGMRFHKSFWLNTSSKPFSTQFTNLSSNILQDYGQATASTNGKLSYVEKMKFFQYLKEDPQKCSALFRKGRFIVYCGSRPLLKATENFESWLKTHLVWLTYEDLYDFKEQIKSSAVLLDVDENKTPSFGIQLGKLGAPEMKKFEDDKNGKFFDLRMALFTVDKKSSQLLSQSNALLMFHKKNMYCGICGEKMNRNCSGYARSCSNCKNTVYPVSNPVGIVLVTDSDNQNVILVRQPSHPIGMYTCIAGFSDVGETLEQTVKREVAEEVGLEVTNIKYVGSQHWPFPGSLMAGCYAVANCKEMAIDSEELEDAQWFTRDQIGKAIVRTESNPSLMYSSSSGTELFIPKPGAIAFALIKHWYDNTNFQEITSKL